MLFFFVACIDYDQLGLDILTVARSKQARSRKFRTEQTERMIPVAAAFSAYKAVRLYRAHLCRARLIISRRTGKAGCTTLSEIKASCGLRVPSRKLCMGLSRSIAVGGILGCKLARMDRTSYATDEECALQTQSRHKTSP